MWKQFYLFLFRSKCDDELSFTTTSSFDIENPPWTNNALKKYKFTFFKTIKLVHLYIFNDATFSFHYSNFIDFNKLNIFFSYLAKQYNQHLLHSKNNPVHQIYRFFQMQLRTFLVPMASFYYYMAPSLVLVGNRFDS